MRRPEGLLTEVSLARTLLLPVVLGPIHLLRLGRAPLVDLLGFVAAAYVTGSLAERGWDRRPLTTVLAMLAGHVALYLPGLFWLSRFVGARVLALGFWPFVPGDLLKMALAMALLPLGWRWLGHHAFTAVNEGE